MPHYLSDEELKRTAPAEVAAYRGPVPTQIVSNGEWMPMLQTEEQQRIGPHGASQVHGVQPRIGSHLA